MSAPWLRAYLTDLLHTWHKCSPWRDSVSRSILGRNFKCLGGHTNHLKWRPVRLFEVFAMSAPWLRPYLAESLHMWHTYNTWGDDVLCIIFRPNHFICGIHITNEGAMCHALFSGWKVKGQGHTGPFNFWHCPLCAFVPIWPNHFICGIHTAHDETMCRAPFSERKVNGQGHTGRSKFITLSAPWLPPYCLVKQVKYVGIWWLRHAAAIRSLDLLVIKHWCIG